MAVMNGGAAEKPNGGVLSSPPPSVVADEKERIRLLPIEGGVGRCELGEEASLSGVFNHLIDSIFDPNPDSRPPLARRIKKSLMEAAPMFREATMKTRREVLEWTRRGSPLRALLVISVGLMSVLALTGMVVFMVFFVAATMNAIIISLLVSMAAVGGFLAIFFACLTTIYISLLFIAAFVTFTVTISSIIAALVAAGWIGFMWLVWLGVSKSARLAKRTLGETSAANVSSRHNIKQPVG